MIAGLMALFGLAATCKAADYHVNTPQTLQNALTLAAASSVSNNIYVTNGYYTGNFNYNSSNVNELTLLAEPGVTNTRIIIDSGGTGSSLSITATASPSITVEGMTLVRDGANNPSGGLQIAGGNTTILVNGCLFLSSTSSSGAGLVISSGSNAIVTNCTAIGINGNGGTGISISQVTGTVTVQNCTITASSAGIIVNGNGGYVATVQNCTISLNGGSGGLTVNNAGAVAVIDNFFIGNVGGGANFGLGNSTVTLTGNTFTGNSTGGDGGGVSFGVSSGGVGMGVYGNTFTSNSANGDGGGVSFHSGAGGYVFPTVASNNFIGNSANGNGGGACFKYSGCFNCSEGEIYGTLTGNSFVGNSATGNGGGAECYTSGWMTVSGNTVVQNTSVFGGGLYASGPTINLLDNLVAKNTGTTISSQGGGIWVDASATLNMINNTVTGNTSAGNGGGMAYIVTGTVELLNIYNNIIWGNSATVNGGDVYLSGTGQKKVFDYNDADSIYGVFDIAQNNIDLSPRFFDPVNGDYHTQSSSLCIADGTTNAPSLPATDLDGSPRILNGLVDLGCYEFNTNVFHPADLAGSWRITSSDFTAYAAAWKSGQTWTNAPNPIPANYLTRAGYLMTNGGAYYNDGSARPVNWKTNQ
jgi:hypothetical protein